MRHDSIFKAAMSQAKEYLETTSDKEMNSLKLDWESDGYPTSHPFIHSIMADFALKLNEDTVDVSNDTNEKFFDEQASQNWRRGKNGTPPFHEVVSNQIEKLSKENEALKSLLLEFIIRSQLTFPLSELQEEQFKEGLDSNKDKVFFPKLMEFIEENQKP